ncbi:YoaK family protein [Paenibacillus filicis]|uniref:YoaK family protein n=1 Tax=Paenibacillus gyeongsangnamensis TaxID=3388067 RepID=A0ABT4Q5J9_9BACL|nr:YoaK family protein [Paenibacillus filicis]MCZ8512154.1 YoaK family protein [Paenibacillus filicis]
MSPTNCRNILLLLLCMTSGIVDVIGYLGLGHVFTANMTGNIVLLGLAIGHSEGLAVLRSAIALTGFTIGTAIAAVIVGRNKEKAFWPTTVTIALCIEGLTLFAYGCIANPGMNENTTYFLISLLSFAMGMQTTAARRLSIAGISTTVLTNNLANVIEDIIASFSLLSRSKTLGNRLSMESILRISAVIIYCFGAIVGAVAENRYPFAIIWVPVSIIAIIILTVLLYFRPKKG